MLRKPNLGLTVARNVGVGLLTTLRYISKIHLTFSSMEQTKNWTGFHPYCLYLHRPPTFIKTDSDFPCLTLMNIRKMEMNQNTAFQPV